MEGTITDQSGAVIASATVTVRNRGTGFSEMATTDETGKYRLTAPAGNYQVSVSAANFETYSARAYVGVGRATEMNAALGVGTSADVIEVTAAADKLTPEAGVRKVGDFFEYDLKQKITIGKNQSALVPILQSSIQAEKVTLWRPSDDEDDDAGHVPLRAVWIKNTSGQVLDSGTFNVLEGGTFAGEGVLDSIHPDERRLLSYAADTAVQVKHEDESSEKPYSRIRIAKGVMVMTREQRESVKFEVHNADKNPREVVLEYPAESGWELTKDSPKPEETTSSFHRFRIPVDPGKTAELKVESVHPEETQYALTNLNSDEVALLVQQQRMTPELEKAFRQVIDQKNVVAGLQSQIESRQQELNAINRDQARIRENMKALKGSPEEKALLQRYTGQLNSQEDRLTVLNKEIAALQQRQTVEQQRLDATVQQVALDESF